MRTRLRDVIIGHIEHECRNLTKTAVYLHELQALSPARQAEIIGDEHAYRRVFVDLLEVGQQAGPAADQDRQDQPRQAAP